MSKSDLEVLQHAEGLKIKLKTFLIEKELETDDGKDIDVYQEFPSELLREFLYSNDIGISDSLANELKSLFSISKYLLLLLDFNKSREIVKKDIEKFIDNTRIDAVYHEHLCNQISFLKKKRDLEEDYTPKSIVISYKVDFETDNVSYFIPGGAWGWEISRAQLKSLLEGVDIDNNTDNVITSVSHKDNADITLNVDGISIIIQRNKGV